MTERSPKKRRSGSSDLLLYFADNPDKLAALQVRDNMGKAAADRVSDAWVRRAFNKFNAPDLVSQLLGVLKKEGLEDAERDLRQKKVPQLIEKAWSERGASVLMARFARMKIAGDMRNILHPLFDSLQPHVKNYSRFIQAVASDLTDGSEFPGMGEWNDGGLGGYTTVTTATGDVEGKQVGGYGKGDDWDPPDYEEGEYTIPEKVAVEVKNSINLRMLPKEFAKKYRSHLTDPRGFMLAMQEMLGNSRALKLLSKLIKNSLQGVLRREDDATIFGWAEYLEDWMNDEVNDGSAGIDVDWSWMGGYPKSIKVKPSGSSIDVSIHLQFEIYDDHSGSASEGDY